MKYKLIALLLLVSATLHSREPQPKDKEIRINEFVQGSLLVSAEMRESGSTSSYNPVLESIFRPEVQPFLLSWIVHDPTQEISELDLPVMIINGTSDFQVSEDEARLLKEARPEAQLVLLEGMNNILTKIEGSDSLTNQKSYNEPGLPLHPELMPTISAFIKDL